VYSKVTARRQLGQGKSTWYNDTSGYVVYGTAYTQRLVKIGGRLNSR